MGERVTIRDVAARAGVSVATVSRVLAGNYPTSTASRAKVLRAVKELDYVANAHARALAGAGRKTIAVLMFDVVGAFYSQVAQGVEMEAAQHGRLTLVASTGSDPARELALVQMMREQAAEAVVLVGGVIEDDEYRERMARYAEVLAAAGSRLVLCGPSRTRARRARAGRGVRQRSGRPCRDEPPPGRRPLPHRPHRLRAGQHHGRGPPPRLSAGARRPRGGPGDAVLHGVGFGRNHGYQAMRDLLDKADGRPDFTAVFAGDDRAAAAAIRALREYGLRVPEDMSVVGYNDDPVAADITPGLTTVHIPAEELGRTAVRRALA
ncbi:LacI family transcriptional regulator OS=Streptomyces alboniger OX=132473 GN=CP975_09905 PE=4 SV=1 [Streptomyces alboniger]